MAVRSALAALRRASQAVDQDRHQCYLARLDARLPLGCWLEVAGLTVDHRPRLYRAPPPPELLADPRCVVETLDGTAW